MEAPPLGRVFDRHLAFPRRGRARLTVESLIDRLASRAEAPLGHRVDALAWAESFFAIEASVGAHEEALTTIGAASDDTAFLEFELGEREFVVLEEADEVIVVSPDGTLVLERTDALIARLHEAQRPRQSVEPASREERATFVSRSGDVRTLDPQVLAALLASTSARVEKAPKVSRVPPSLASVGAVRWLPIKTPLVARRAPAHARPMPPTSIATHAVDEQKPASKTPMRIERRVPIASALTCPQPSRTSVTVIVQRPSFALVERIATRLGEAEKWRWRNALRTAEHAAAMPAWVRRALVETGDVRAKARIEARAQLPRVEGERVVVMRVESDAPDGPGVSWPPLAREVLQPSVPPLISVDAMPATVLLTLYGALDRTAAWERISPASWTMPARVLESPASIVERVVPVLLQTSAQRRDLVDAPRQASLSEKAFLSWEPPREIHQQQRLIEQRALMFALPFGADGGLRVGPEISHLAVLPVPIVTRQQEGSSVVIGSEKFRSLVLETERVGVEFVSPTHESERPSVSLDPLRLSLSLRSIDRLLPAESVRIRQDVPTYAEQPMGVASARAPHWRDATPQPVPIGASAFALNPGDAGWRLPPLVQVCERRVPAAYEESVSSSSDEILIPLPLWGRMPPASLVPASRQTRIGSREIRTEWSPPESITLASSAATAATSVSRTLISQEPAEGVRPVMVRAEGAPVVVMPGASRPGMAPLRFRFPTTARWWSETPAASPAAGGVLASRSLTNAVLVRSAPASADTAPRYMSAPGRERSTGRAQKPSAAKVAFVRAGVEAQGQSTLEIDVPTPALVGGPVDAVVDERRAAVGIDRSGDAVLMPQARMPAPGRAPDMTLVAAIAPQAPSLEEMVNADRERALAKGRRNDAAPLAAESGPEGLPLQGSVDAIAQRIYHRLKRRLQSDRERMGG